MNSVNTMLRGQSWLSLCCVLASLWDQVVSDVIVETVIGFKPARIYEDAADRFGDALPETGLVGFLVKGGGAARAGLRPHQATCRTGSTGFP